MKVESLGIGARPDEKVTQAGGVKGLVAVVRSITDTMPSQNTVNTSQPTRKNSSYFVTDLVPYSDSSSTISGNP